MAEDVVERNRRQQIEWYGEPLSDRIGRLLDRLELSQSGLAGFLGLSAPMLSQLMSANRAKISNPAVLSRLLAIEAMVNDPSFDLMPSKDVRARLTAISSDPAVSSTTTRVATAERPAHASADTVGTIQSLLREVASAEEVEGAAQLLDGPYPDLAEFLRVYGRGRSSDARAHLAKTLGP